MQNQYLKIKAKLLTQKWKRRKDADAAAIDDFAERKLIVKKPNTGRENDKTPTTGDTTSVGCCVDDNYNFSNCYCNQCEKEN